MLRIAKASVGEKNCWTISALQAHVYGSMSKETFASCGTLAELDVILKVDGLVSHLSLQICSDCPFSTYHRCIFWTIFWPAKILRQAKKGWLPNLAERKSPSRKYRSLKTLWTNEVVLVCNLQPCFAERAWLKALRSRKSKPPSSFGRHVLSQLNQAILFFSFVFPHQNLHTILVISSQRTLGSLKKLIVYVGTTCALILIKISFPAWDNNFSLHPESLSSNLSINWWNVLHLLFSTSDGSLRYFSCCLMISAPNLCLISS